MQQTLCLHLLCERARGAASRWAPYIAMLPDQRHHPLLWPRAAASQWLAGSPSLGTLEERWEQCEEDYLALRHLVGVASLDRILAAQQVGMDGEAGDEVEGRRVEDSARADRAAAEPATRMSQQPLVTRASVRCVLLPPSQPCLPPEATGACGCQVLGIQRRTRLVVRVVQC